MNGILIYTGVEIEARALARALGLPRQPSPGLHPAWGRPTRNGSQLLLTVGPSAEKLAEGLPDRPRVFLGVGLGGGLAPDLTPGCLIIGEQVVDNAGNAWRSDSELVGMAIRSVSRLGLPHRVGTLATHSHLVSTPAAKAVLWRDSGALAVDMESAHFLTEARRQGIPALAVRAIADGPNMALDPVWMQVITSRGALDPGRLVRVFLSRPGLLAQAVRLGWVSRRALSHLARFLPAFLGEADSKIV